MKLFFYIFLFGTLSFGRAFSILHIDTPFSPVFITEIFLILNIPILFYKYKVLLKLPKTFLILFSIYFAYTFLYLCAGLFTKNIFALRDIPISVYLLFLPITFIYFNKLSEIKPFIIVIILSNIINLYSGWCLLNNRYLSELFANFISKSKLFNFGLYYGMLISLIITFYDYVRSNAYRLFTLIILLLNVYTLIAIGLTSLWAAFLSLLVFLFLILRGRFLKLILFFIPVFLLTSLIMFYGFRFISPDRIAKFFDEAKGLSTFVSKAVYQNKPKKLSCEAKVNLAVIPYQDETKKVYNDEEISLLNINWRLSIWKQTLRFASDSPLFGKGFGTYPVYKILTTYQYPRHAYTDSGIIPAHNHLLTIFLKLGILGLGLFLFLNIYVFRYALLFINKCNLGFIKNLLTGLLGAFVFWHALALCFDVIDSPPTSIFLWIIIGLIFAVIEISRNQTTND